MVLLPGADHRDAIAIADRLRTAVEHLTVPLGGGKVLTCTISIGLSRIDGAGQTWSAKHRGRNRIETASTLPVGSNDLRAGPPAGAATRAGC